MFANGQSRDEWCPKIEREFAKADGESKPDKRTKALEKTLSMVNGGTWSSLVCSDGVRVKILDSLGRTDEAYKIAETVSLGSMTSYMNDSEVIAAFKPMSEIALKTARKLFAEKKYVDAARCLDTGTRLTQRGSDKRRELDELAGDLFTAMEDYKTAGKFYALADRNDKVEELKNVSANKDSSDETAVKADGTPDYERRDNYYYRKHDEARKEKKFEEAVKLMTKRIELSGTRPGTYYYYVFRAEDEQDIALRDNSQTAANACIGDIQTARNLPDFKKNSTDTRIAANCLTIVGQYQSAYDELVYRANALSPVWFDTDWNEAVWEQYSFVNTRAKAANKNIVRNDALEKGITKLRTNIEQKLARLAADPKSSDGKLFIYDGFISYFDTAVYLKKFEPENAAANRALEEVYGFFLVKPNFAPPEKFRTFLVNWSYNASMMLTYYKEISANSDMADVALENSKQSAWNWDREAVKMNVGRTSAYCVQMLENANFFENYAKSFTDPKIVPPVVYAQLQNARNALPKFRQVANSCINDANKIIKQNP
ncbi:MAG TPA: hypothetical protein PKY59_06985 [Pyrinomonadaceae bacterium]|nr:hypothetical protein [Pyrinomonadaceae bacterium]